MYIYYDKNSIYIFAYLFAQLQEIGQYSSSLWSHNGLRMKLQAINCIFLVLHSHDFPIISHSRHLQALRQRLLLYSQGMIPCRHKVTLQPLQQFILLHHSDFAGLAMHQLLGITNSRTIHLTNSLMPQAYSEGWDLL